MITRIVKMTFQPEKTKDFLMLFKQNEIHIAGFKGCRKLKLLKDISTDHIFITYSKWDSLEDLENYRKSELFQSVWAKTKVLFSEKPEAWSLIE